MLVNLPPATWSSFELELELYVGDGTGGEGMSVCLGALPDAPFGEYGSGDGLRLLLRTHEGDLQAWYGGVAAVRRPFDASLLRASRFVALRLQYSDAGLVVELGGVELVRGLVFGRWSPEPGWRVGIGARTGAGRTDAHRVSAVRFSAGAGDPSPALVEVASNGQQFSSSRIAFAYTIPPVVSGFYPERGPLSGSTQVVIRGARLGGGSHYVCSFGELVVPASFDESGGTVHCASAARAAGPAMLEVSLNAQQYTNSSVRFEYYANPEVSLASPDAGPTSGGTLVRVHGSGLDAGADCRCRFGETEVNASLDRYTLLCISPSVECLDPPCMLNLSVSLNSQQ